MRNISPASLALIQSKTGLQPINFIGVQWVDYGDTHYYCDRRIDGTNFEPKILELGNIENVVKVSDNSRSQSVSVKLDDTDGSLKNIIDSADIHKRQVSVFQWFSDGSTQVIPFSEAFIIFQGEVNSPIVWKEGDRTLSFEIVEKVEDKEVGFSVEEGQFDFVPEEFVGKPFPLGFGTNIRVPALQINAPPVGLTRHPIGFADPTLKPKINQNALKIKALQEAQWLYALYAGEAAMSAYLLEGDIDKLERYLAGAINWNEIRGTLLANNTGTFLLPGNTTVSPNTGSTYEIPSSAVPSYDGGDEQLPPEEDAFTPNYSVPANPQGGLTQRLDNSAGFAEVAIGEVDDPIDTSAITSAISSLRSQVSQMRSLQKQYEAKSAQFSAQIAQIITDNKNLAKHLDNQTKIGQVTSVINGEKFPRGPIRVKINEAEMLGSFTDDVFHPSTKKGEILVNPNDKRDPNRKPSLDENIEKGKFTVINPGASVKLTSEFPIHFIVNIIPSDVFEVMAKRSASGKDGGGGGQAVMTPVPPSYYSVSQYGFGIYNTTVVTLNRGLSTYDEGWEDQIYVSFTSNVGPNTIDILTWLITTYTTHSYDFATFSALHGLLAQFPSNFVLFDRKNILTILEEIAFQARLGLWLDNGVFKIKYLPLESGSVDTITEQDIEFGTLELEHSRTEDIVTKFVARYKFHHEDKEPNKIVLRYNINKYGTVVKEYDYYAYNISSCVYMSAVFWILRKANTWKKIKFKTPLHKLNLETYDTILLNFTNPYVAFVPVLGIIESCKYDSQNWSIEFEVWTPVRIGEMFPYYAAWPAGISQYFSFPSNEEVSDGSVGVAPNSSVGGQLPGHESSFGTPVFNNPPPEMPRIKNQGNRPRDHGPKNISDSGHGQFKISEVPSNPGSFAGPISDAQPYVYRNYGEIPPVPKKPFEDEDIPDPGDTEGTSIPIRIISGSGNKYSAYGYKKGILKDPVVISVVMIDIDSTETIPPGTWWFATKSGHKYLMQMPIWVQS